jgi:hypothetical protein
VSRNRQRAFAAEAARGIDFVEMTRVSDTTVICR